MFYPVFIVKQILPTPAPRETAKDDYGGSTREARGLILNWQGLRETAKLYLLY